MEPFSLIQSFKLIMTTDSLVVVVMIVEVDEELDMVIGEKMNTRVELVLEA